MADKIQGINMMGHPPVVSDRLEDIYTDWQGQAERFMFVTPHDDDVVLGGGLTMQIARAHGVPCSLVVVTDGRMGYCLAEHRDDISVIRSRETTEAYGLLGIDEADFEWLEFPDCDLNNYCGRRRAVEGDPGVIAGHTGMQNSFTHYLRKIRPTRVFVPTAADLHPDHQLVNRELLISLFHSTGQIWPELGDVLGQVPQIYEMAVYCDFPATPQIRWTTGDDMLRRKLEAIGRYRSQMQIDSVIDITRKVGPVEYLRKLDFALYRPQRYHGEFEYALDDHAASETRRMAAGTVGQDRIRRFEFESSPGEADRV